MPYKDSNNKRKREQQRYDFSKLPPAEQAHLEQLAGPMGVTGAQLYFDMPEPIRERMRATVARQAAPSSGPKGDGVKTCMQCGGPSDVDVAMNIFRCANDGVTKLCKKCWIAQTAGGHFYHPCPRCGAVRGAFSTFYLLEEEPCATPAVCHDCAHAWAARARADMTPGEFIAADTGERDLLS